MESSEAGTCWLRGGPQHVEHAYLDAMLSKLGIAASLLMLWHSSVSDRAFGFWCDSWACNRKANINYR